MLEFKSLEEITKNISNGVKLWYYHRFFIVVSCKMIIPGSHLVLLLLRASCLKNRLLIKKCVFCKIILLNVLQEQFGAFILHF